MENRKIMFFDIDGTLLPFTHDTLTEKTKNALIELQKNGVILGIATGRRRDSVERIFKDIPLDFIVSSNGRDVMIEGKTQYTNPIPKDVIERMITFDLEENVGLNVSSRTSIATYQPITEKGRHYLESLHEKLPEVNKKFFFEEEILQSMIYCDEVMEEKFRHTFPELALVRHKNDGIDVLAAGPMKEKGLEIVLEHYNLSQNDALAFGDGLNDYGMFEYVDGVALDVAHPELVKISKTQIGKVEEDGAAQFLKEKNYI